MHFVIPGTSAEFPIITCFIYYPSFLPQIFNNKNKGAHHIMRVSKVDRPACNSGRDRLPHYLMNTFVQQNKYTIILHRSQLIF